MKDHYFRRDSKISFWISHWCKGKCRSVSAGGVRAWQFLFCGVA
jgi:hypothetical protein